MTVDDGFFLLWALSFAVGLGLLIALVVLTAPRLFAWLLRQVVR